MGLSWFMNCVGDNKFKGKGANVSAAVCNPPPDGVARPTPLPLMANLTVIEQPAGLYTLAQRYATAAVQFITNSAAAAEPFLLYLPFNHIHTPNSCSAGSCGQSTRGPIGDATEDMDHAVGVVMAAIRAEPKVATSTLTFFTSDNGSPQRPDGNLPLRGYKASICECTAWLLARAACCWL
jgi:arylsulfatase A